MFNSSTANLTLTDCTVSGDASGGGRDEGGGGGLANYGTATLTGCTLSDNYAPSYNGYYNGLSGFGGGVLNSGTANLTLTGCTVSGNSAVGSGGGVSNSGYATLTLTDCALSGNSAYSGGGVDNGGTAYLTDCTLSGNSADKFGGGLSNGGLVTLTGCTLSGNTGYGGGLANRYATANLTDCTVSGNSTAAACSIMSGTANLTDCTVSGNSGGGLNNTGYGNIPAGPATLTDTIVAGNTNGSGVSSDIGGTNVSGSDNLIGTGGSGGLVNGVDGNIVLTSLTDLGLAPLGNNGGPTQTMALLPGSAAIGAGVIADYPGTTTPITTDQRGEPARLAQSRHRRLPDPGFHTHRADLLGNQRPEHHLRHLQRDHLRYAGQRLAGPGGRERRRDLGRRPAVGHHRLRRRLLHAPSTPLGSPWPIRPTRSPTRIPATGPSPPPAPPAR